jgi:hypothetical protein
MKERPPRHNPEVEEVLRAWDELDGIKLPGYRVIDERGSDGIEVSLYWKVDSEPPAFAVTVEDNKLNVSYAPLLATLENYRDIYRHPMSHLAEIATKACGVESERK